MATPLISKKLSSNTFVRLDPLAPALPPRAVVTRAAPEAWDGGSTEPGGGGERKQGYLDRKREAARRGGDGVTASALSFAFSHL